VSHLFLNRIRRKLVEEDRTQAIEEPAELFSPHAAEDGESVRSIEDSAPDYPPESLTAEQIRYALSQWLLARRLGRRAGRVILQDAAAVLAYHRKHNTAAKISHTRITCIELSQRGIDVHRIRSCLDSNFALYC